MEQSKTNNITVNFILPCFLSRPQSFAENTMNELLGWYGYDKVELRDSEDIDIRNYPDGDMRQHISVLKGEHNTELHLN